MGPVAPGGDRWTGTIGAALGAALLGRALQVDSGHFRPEAVAMLTLAFAILLEAVAAPELAAIARHGPSAALAAVAVCVGYEAVDLLGRSPGVYLHLAGRRDLLPFFGGIVVSAALAGLSLARESWRRVCVPLLLLVQLVLGVWMIHMSSDPRIDVHVFQRDASAALLSGHSPYGIAHPGLGVDPRFYGPGLVVDGRPLIGLPYPPLSALLSLPGHLLGDHRYSLIAATIVSAALMAWLRPGPLPAGAAALFLFTPRRFFVLEQGFTEPYVVLALTCVVLCARRFRRALPYAVGLFFAVKQYAVLAAPLLTLLLPRPLSWREIWGFAWRAGATALAVTLPLALVDPSAFVRDVVLFQIRQPFRWDSLSFLAWLARVTSAPLPAWWGFLALAAVTALALWRAPRTPAGFALGVGVAFLGFFAWGKQAFANYYLFVVGALCLAVAASDPDA